MYRLYRVMLNSRGDGVSSSRHGTYADLFEATEAADHRWYGDNMRQTTEWKVVDEATGRTEYRICAATP